jgi:hypothetical protein
MIYGIHARDEWQLRRALPPGDPRRMDLSDTRESSAAIARRPATQVSSFVELVSLIAFLSVMNKRLVLLFRGQRQDFPLRPTLFRDTWKSPLAPDSERVPLADARMHYWAALTSVESIVMRVLERHGVPRWRHLKAYREARWAVIQHYELWPTPLLDLTSSLRVAASFAFGCDPNAPEGFLYVLGVSRVRGDLMDLAEARLDPAGGDRPEREAGVLAIRLNSVCPPSALRPHLQEGVLIGPYPSLLRDSVEPAGDIGSKLVAKLKLINSRSGFWSTPDYPIHSVESLLPSGALDPLQAELSAETRQLKAVASTLSTQPQG